MQSCIHSIRVFKKNEKRKKQKVETGVKRTIYFLKIITYNNHWGKTTHQSEKGLRMEVIISELPKIVLMLTMKKKKISVKISITNLNQVSLNPVAS